VSAFYNGGSRSSPRQNVVNPDTLTLFREVANRSLSEREEYYVRNQVSAALRREVESLLEAGERTVDSFAGHLASAAVRALLDDPLAPAETPPAAAPARSTLQPATIGRYRVIRLLGRGGMSDVYLARDPMLERDIAVKLIAGGLDDDVARRRLVREASAVGRLRHPNIVTIFDAGEHDGRPFIAMEHVPGDTLRTLIQRRVPMPLRRRLELIENACAGLAHAHRAGVVHLDIKPDNLIVDESGVLKVLDFGIARVLSSEALATRHILGTLRYMSPEQIAGDPLDHRSDIFSLGCSMYELLAYLPAYAGSTREIVYRIAVGPVPRLCEVMPDIDPRLDAAVGRAMALEAADRFADLDEFQAELARLRAELDPAGEHAMVMPDPRLVEQSHTFAVPTPAKASGSAPLTPTSTESTADRSSAAGPRQRAMAIAGAVMVLAAAGGGVWWSQTGADVESGFSRTPSSEQAPAATPAMTVAPPPAPLPVPAPLTRPPEAVSAPDSEVWKHLAKGDRVAAVGALRAVASNGRGAESRLPYDVLKAVQDAVAKSRAAATAAAGATATAAYQSAEKSRLSAGGLEASGNFVGAIEVLWQAGDLYDQALIASRSATPSLAAGREPADAAPSAGATQGVSAQSPVPSPVATPQPSAAAAVPPPIPAPQPQAAPRVTASGPAAASAVERSAGAAPRTPTDEERVRQALDVYRAAYQNKNVTQLIQVYPSLAAQATELRNSMEDIATYELEIRVERVELEGNTAIVPAVLKRRITPHIGAAALRSETETAFVFRLRREGTNWLITSANPR
jgi:serine/threonine-protein kinase